MRRRKYSIDGLKTVGATLATTAVFSGGASAAEAMTDFEPRAVASAEVDLTWQETQPDHDTQSQANKSLVGSHTDINELTHVYPQGESYYLNTPNDIERIENAGAIIAREFATKAANGQQVTIEHTNALLEYDDHAIRVRSIEERNNMLVASELETRVLDEIIASKNVKRYEDLETALRNNPDQFSATERIILTNIFNKAHARPYDISLFDAEAGRALNGTIYTYGHKENDAFMVIDMYDTNVTQGIADVPLNLLIVPIPWFRRRDETDEYIDSAPSLRAKYVISNAALERTISYDRTSGQMVERPKPTKLSRLKRYISGAGYGSGKHRKPTASQPATPQTTPKAVSSIQSGPQHSTSTTSSPRHARQQQPKPIAEALPSLTTTEKEWTKRHLSWNKIGAVALTATLATAHVLSLASDERRSEPTVIASSSTPELSPPIDTIDIETCGGNATVNLGSGEFGLIDTTSCIGVQVNHYIDGDQENYKRGQADDKLTLITLTPEQPATPPDIPPAAPPRNWSIANGMGGEQLMISAGFNSQDWYRIDDQLVTTFPDQFYEEAPGDVYLQNPGPLPAEVQQFIISQLQANQ